MDLTIFNLLKGKMIIFDIKLKISQKLNNKWRTESNNWSKEYRNIKSIISKVYKVYNQISLLTIQMLV